MPNNKRKTVLIKVESNACGKEILRPACKNAILFLGLTRNKSLTADDLEKIIALGFELEFK